MTKRPTIAELAAEAGVSVSTVNRILAGKTKVHPATFQMVQAAAERIGYYGIGAIEARREAQLPTYRFGFLLQQSTREVYRIFARGIQEAAANRRDVKVTPLIDFVDLLEPSNIASRLIALGKECDAVAVIAADHPLIGQAIRELHHKGTPTVAYITDQSAPERAAYVGADNWKLGRTAAWFISEMSPAPGTIALFLGNHRYQCQDMADAAFRSYVRENAPHLTILDSRPTNEDSSEAYHMVKELLISEDNLAGLMIAGGGISGILKALREAPPDQRKGVRVICRDIGPEARKGLTEGLITAALCHPLEEISSVLIQTMIDVTKNKEAGLTIQRAVPIEIVTPQNL